jgi:hypothetical protein
MVFSGRCRGEFLEYVGGGVVGFGEKLNAAKPGRIIGCNGLFDPSDISWVERDSNLVMTGWLYASAIG